MRVSLLSGLLLCASSTMAMLEARQNITGLGSVPQCAQTCLSNSTNLQGACSDLDIKCLCGNQQYVNSLSCCLATNCDAADQSKAILFNQQECESVGQTAPGFVGCSPFSLSSFVGLGSSASTMPPSTLSVASTAVNPYISTITASTDTDFGWETVSGLHPTTVSFSKRPMLTGSCTVPNFALATNALNASFLYPEVGCSNFRQDCCPYNAHEFAVLPECPLDYYTTGVACCPSGYQVFPSALGYETPCYTVPSITLVPAVTPSISGITIITGMVFSRKYLLQDPTLTTSTTPGVPKGAIIGIALGATNAVIFLLILFFFMRRRAQRRKQAEEARKNAFVPRTREMDEPHDFSRPSELASPQSQPMSPHPTSAMTQRSSGQHSNWPMGPGSPPPTYDPNSAMRPPPAKMIIPQELPGSTYIYEHHPAFETDTSDGAATATTATATVASAPSAVSEPRTPGGSEPPRSPTRSPVHTPPTAAHSAAGTTVSPMLSPSSTK